MRTWRRWAGAVVAAVACLAPGAARAQDNSDEKEPPPKHAIEKADENEKKVYAFIKHRAQALGAEQVASIAGRPGFGLKVGTSMAPMLETFLWGYRYSGDTAWLKRFEAVMGGLEKALVKDPDGNVGWYSAAGSQRFGDPFPPTWPDASQLAAWQQAEARVVAVCADFEMTVREEPALKDAFLLQAKRWTRLGADRLMPKWDKRCYVELSEDRAVYTWPPRVFRAGTMRWEAYPNMANPDDNVTLPHPAVSEIILQYLKLWQLTEKPSYRARAAKLLRWQKSCLRFLRKGRRDRRGRRRGPVDDSVTWWNYWDPSGDYDFRPEGGLAFGMYMGLEPPKYARDVAAFVEAYHSGVVIDKGDIERLVTTQKKMMKTGDPAKPTWKNQLGEQRGMLWPHLGEFDDTLDQLVALSADARSNEFGSPLRFMQERLRWGGWERRKLGDARAIGWGKTHKDFAKEMDELIRAHPPPDPRKSSPRRR